MLKTFFISIWQYYKFKQYLMILIIELSLNIKINKDKKCDKMKQTHTQNNTHTHTYAHALTHTCACAHNSHHTHTHKQTNKCTIDQSQLGKLQNFLCVKSVKMRQEKCVQYTLSINHIFHSKFIFLLKSCNTAHLCEFIIRHVNYCSIFMLQNFFQVIFKWMKLWDILFYFT